MCAYLAFIGVVKPAYRLVWFRKRALAQEQGRVGRWWGEPRTGSTVSKLEEFKEARMKRVVAKAMTTQQGDAVGAQWVLSDIGPKS